MELNSLSVVYKNISKHFKLNSYEHVIDASRNMVHKVDKQGLRKIKIILLRYMNM